MVGLRLQSGYAVEKGDDLVVEVVPWAAALSDLLLSSNCAACFGPCSTLRLPCPGPCQGALLYCSPSCQTLDLPLHFRSAECNLLSLVRSSISPVSSFSFPSLGGTCDIRTALRLLDRYYSLNNITSFLAASQCSNGLDHPRLGGLASNRSSLLQISTSGNSQDDEELQLATELREAAVLMCHVRYCTPGVPCACKCTMNAEHIPAGHMDCCMTEKRQFARFCGDTEGTVEVAYTTDTKTGRDVLPLVVECMECGRHGDLCGKEHVGEWEIVQENGCPADANQHTSAPVHAYIKGERTVESFPFLTQAGKILLVEEVLCQVFTNGIRIHMDTWIADRKLNVQSTDYGTAVYGPLLSWINHSCRPNAFFSFMFASQAKSRESTPKDHLDPDINIKGLEDTWGLRSAFLWSDRADDQGQCCLQHYSPCARLRAIRKIEGLEPVRISYIDSVLPKSMRRQELWLKYRFHCTCERCEVKSTEGVDGILQKLGDYENQDDVLILEECLSKDAEHAFREFLENDNPWSCCEILEGAMLKLMHHTYRSHFNSPQCLSLQESVNYGEHQCSEVSMTHRRHVKLHLMHHLCLNIYMTLTSSYKVLAMGCSDSSDEGPSRGITAARSPKSAERREVECSMSSAAYSLVQANMSQHLCDFGEPGLLAVTARLWLQNWESLMLLILKLDSFFHVDSMSETQNLLSTCIYEFKSIIFFLDSNSLCKLKGLLSMCGSLQNCDSTTQLIRLSATALWPFLRSTSPFLSNIQTPFDISEVCLCTEEIRRGLPKSKDDWLCYRGEALIFALCSFQYSFKLLNILYGSGDELLDVMQDFLSYYFCKGSAT